MNTIRRMGKRQGGIEVTEFPENEVANLHVLINNSNSYKKIDQGSFNISYQDLGPFGIYIYSIQTKNPSITNELEELDLSGLSILYINHPNVFNVDEWNENFKKVKRLNLSYNYLYQFNLNHIIQIPSIEELNLSHNYLNTIHYENLSPTTINLKKINLEDNLLQVISDLDFLKDISVQIKINLRYNFLTYKPEKLYNFTPTSINGKRLIEGVNGSIRSENNIIFNSNQINERNEKFRGKYSNFFLNKEKAIFYRNILHRKFISNNRPFDNKVEYYLYLAINLAFKNKTEYRYVYRDIDSIIVKLVNNSPLFFHNFIKKNLERFNFFRKITKRLNPREELFEKHMGILKNTYFTKNLNLYYYRLEKIYLNTPEILQLSNDEFNNSLRIMNIFEGKNKLEIYSYLYNLFIHVIKKKEKNGLNLQVFNQNIEKIKNLKILYFRGLCELFMNYIMINHNNEEVKKNYFKEIFKYSSYFIYSDVTPIEDKNVLYTFIEKNYQSNIYFQKICELTGKDIHDILLEYNLLSMLNCDRNNNFFSLLYSFFGSIETNLKDIIICYLCKKDPIMRDLLKYLQLFEKDQPLMGHIISSQYDTIYILYKYILKNINYNNNNILLNENNIRLNNYNYKSIPKLLKNYYYFLGHGKIISEETTNTPFFYLCKKNYKFHFGSTLFNNGIGIMNINYTISQPEFYENKLKETEYRNINEYSTYSQGMFMPFILFDFDAEPNFGYEGLIPFSKIFLYEKLTYYNNTYEENNEYGTVFNLSHSRKIDSREVKSSRKYNTYIEDLLLKYNTDNIIPNKPEIISNLPYAFTINNFVHYLENSKLKDQEDVNIFLSSCRSEKYVNKARKSTENLKEDMFLRVYKEIMKKIVKIKESIQTKERLVKEKERFIEGSNLSEKERREENRIKKQRLDELKRRYGNNPFFTISLNNSNVNENINRQTYISLSNKSISSFTNDDGIYNIFEIMEDLKHYNIFLFIDCEIETNSVKIQLLYDTYYILNDPTKEIYTGVELIFILTNLSDVYDHFNNLLQTNLHP